MVNVFVPLYTFEDCVASLDMARLGKQRVETLQILNVLCDGLTKKGEPYRAYLNHPAAVMWKGHEGALLEYQRATVAEWAKRPRKSSKPAAPDTCLPQSEAVYSAWMQRQTTKSATSLGLNLPAWWGREDVHESHRSNLIRKDPAYYLPEFGDITRENLPYIWVTKEEN